MKKFLIILSLVLPLALLGRIKIVHASPNNELDYSSMILNYQIESHVKNIKSYIEENPDVTDDELEEYTKTLIIDNYNEEEIAKQQIQKFAYDYADSLPIISSTLGPNEKKVFNDNVTKGLLTVNNAAAATNSTNSTWFANYGFHNDNADAYRHALWNAYTARDCGSDYAKRFADAHELDFPNPELEKEMDLYNNSKGRIIGSKNYSGSNESNISYQIRQNVIQAIKNGEMKRYVGTDIGSLNYLTYTNNTLLIETHQYGWALKNDNWYWYENGQLAKSVWKQINGSWYYLKSDGVMATKWQQINGKWYFFYDGGSMATGWIQPDSYWYYLDTVNGDMKTGWQSISGKWYYFYSPSGRMATNTVIDGWRIDSNGVATPLRSGQDINESPIYPEIQEDILSENLNNIPSIETETE